MVQGAVERAAHCVDSVYSLHGCAGLFSCHQLHVHADAADHQNAFFRFHLACYVRNQLSVTRIDVARFQRTSKCAEHSTGGGGDNVINRGSVGLREFGSIDLIVFCNRTVDAENNGLRFTGQIGNTQRTDPSFDAGLGNVDYLRHGCLRRMPARIAFECVPFMSVCLRSLLVPGAFPVTRPD